MSERAPLALAGLAAAAAEATAGVVELLPLGRLRLGDGRVGISLGADRCHVSLRVRAADSVAHPVLVGAVATNVAAAVAGALDDQRVTVHVQVRVHALARAATP